MLRGVFIVPFGILFLDVDHFKKVNDTYGHEMGDKILAMSAKSITASIRKLDHVCRWGGEEFIIVLPNVDETILRESAERIRTFIEKSFIMRGDEKIVVTASIGGAMASTADSLQTIVEKADRKMYASKQSGRNKVTI